MSASRRPIGNHALSVLACQAKNKVLMNQSSSSFRKPPAAFPWQRHWHHGWFCQAAHGSKYRLVLPAVCRAMRPKLAENTLGDHWPLILPVEGDSPPAFRQGRKSQRTKKKKITYRFNGNVFRYAFFTFFINRSKLKSIVLSGHSSRIKKIISLAHNVRTGILWD